MLLGVNSSRSGEQRGESGVGALIGRLWHVDRPAVLKSKERSSELKYGTTLVRTVSIQY